MPTTASRPTIFALHGLGLSGRLFDPLARELAGTADVVAIDLPGYGDARDAVDTSLAAMTTAVIRVIREHGATRWLLVGHSMGGKVASLVAERTLSGRSGLFGLAGVVLLAGSPLSPEPMPEEKRSEMLGWAADGPLSEQHAREFLEQNIGGALPAAEQEQALADLLRSSPAAWRDWLQSGSREDRSDLADALRALPALLIAGGEDGDLGADGQRATNARTYPRAGLVELPGAGHLLPIERPVEVAAAIRAFWDEEAGTGPAVPADVAATIRSSRTTSRIRALFAERLLADDPGYAPAALSPAQLTTLRAVADRVVPQDSGESAVAGRIDLAARVDAQLAAGRGDGWRNADLPSDPEAYRLGLDALEGFAALAPAEQDARLEALGTEPLGAFGAEQAKAWFEDCRNDLVRQWLAHPASLARIGFDGYATGGDVLPLLGFTALAAGDHDTWEPGTARTITVASSTSPSSTTQDSTLQTSTRDPR
ncbi:alpha/beta hydrolase [Rathayibacter sp. VKM Ac-2856]|uniref:alpha/beta hydrolase n=1 Tax=unclassified Rathayibacter TaxID=2609250 RepID=UPI0015674033|nr:MULTISPECIES: alpha/beta hydrolase [unclassified Rathayibacter]NQX05533.1 alpha/beta hydrolase [Rathayibacter sp. VKM Ac-2858]NQX20592.1 alpha/beta hydrolase [Rathayibacter sp. VKM Ac-2856]